MPELTPEDEATIKAAMAALYDFHWRLVQADAHPLYREHVRESARRMFTVLQNHSR